MMLKLDYTLTLRQVNLQIKQLEILPMRMEKLKMEDLVQPGSNLQLNLERKDTMLIYFTFTMILISHI